MTKKKPVAKSEGGKVKGERGWKVCPECQESCGVRLGQCKKCGHVFRPKSEPTSNVPMPPQQFQAAMQFVLAAGGFPEARRALNESEAFFKQMEAWKNEVGKGTF